MVPTCSQTRSNHRVHCQFFLSDDWLLCWQVQHASNKRFDTLPLPLGLGLRNTRGCSADPSGTNLLLESTLTGVWTRFEPVHWMSELKTQITARVSSTDLDCAMGV